jgi:cyclic pyranopterin phosphate synthase
MTAAPIASPPSPPSPAPSGLLLDRQRRRIDYLRISVTDRCNLRCTYCLPEEGVATMPREGLLSFEEIVALVRCFARLGVRRLRLTGGEPTVRRDLPALVRMLRRVPGIEDLALSTNGVLLAELAAPLRSAGVDRLNISVDTLEGGRFARITRGGRLERVLEGIEAARAAGFAAIKLNTVAVRGFNDDELPALAAYAWARGLVPRFIEQMPMADGALFVPGTLMGAADIRAAIAAAHPGSVLQAEAASPAAGAGPARYWRLDGDGDGEKALRRFGIISPMTEHFCDTCNRVRLSASGMLHTCLAFDDATDLRAVLRAAGDDGVVETIRAAVTGKRDGHTFGLLGIGGPRKAMIQIGG